MPSVSTRDLIIENADTLFYQGGFEGTSFADIAKTVGISRGNFYHHFKTKDEILDGVITLRLARTRDMLDAWHTNGTGPRDRILSFVQMLITNRSKIMAFGCPVGTLCSELAKLDHIAQHRAAEILGLFRDWLAVQFRALEIGGSPQDRAMHLLVWSQGVAVTASAFRDETALRREVAAMAQWLDSLIENQPKGPICS